MKLKLLLFILCIISVGIKAQSIKVEKIFSKEFDEVDAIQPKLEMDGNYLFTAFDVDIGKNEIAFLSSVSPEIIIYDLHDNRRIDKFTVDIFPNDFAYSNDKFYLLYDKTLNIYTRNGALLEIIYFQKSFEFIHDIKIVNNAIYLLTADEKTLKVSNNTFEEVSHQWVFSSDIELKTVISKENSFSIEGVFQGMPFSSNINLEPRMASVIPLGIIDGMAYLYFEKFINESPLQIEPRILVYSISTGKIILNQKLPNVFYTYMKNSFEFCNGKLYHFVSTSKGIQIFNLSFNNILSSNNYPTDLLNQIFHYNNILLDNNELKLQLNQNQRMLLPCNITQTQVETNALAYRDLVWNFTANSLSSPCTNRCSNLCKTTLPNGDKIVTPAYILGIGSYTGVPYKWGGYTAVNSFNTLANQGRYVGNWLTYAPGTCSDALADDNDADTYVIGVDCSGFVSRCWNAPHMTTSSLHTISTQINASNVELGDVFNKSGSHVRLFLSGNPTGTMNLIESTTGYGAKVRSGSYLHGDLTTYVPRRYNNICASGGNPTLDCSSFIQLTCGVPYTGSYSSATSNVTTYGCNTWTETGPERIHKITASVSGTLTATISNFTGDLDVYILGSCDPTNCLGTVYSSSAEYTGAVSGNTYYIIVDADDGSGSGYDLLVTCTPTTPLLPDLSVSNISSNPTSVCAGGNVSVYSYVNNTGTTNSGMSTMKYYLSTNTTFGGDTYLGSSNIPSINAGNTSSQISTSLTIPGGTLPGSYYILFYADAPTSIITESNENNNIAFKPFAVNNCTASPDIIISNPFFTVYSLCAGSNITVSCDIENIGGSTAVPSTIKYFLSYDQLLGGDTLLGSTSIGSLSNGTSTSLTSTLAIPAGTTVGTRYILIIADYDNDVIEGANGESNNLFTDQIQIVSCAGLADLIISYNSHTPAIINPGALIQVNYDSENIGGTYAPINKIGIYISDDNNFNPQTDVFLDDWTQTSLDPSEVDNDNLNFSIPDCYQCGTFYIFLVIDYQHIIPENDESNNYDSFQVQITGCITCSYTVPPIGINFLSSGGTGNFNITTTQCCEYIATTADSFITIINGYGFGSGTVFYEVSPCSGGGSRTGTITVGGQVHQITQDCSQLCNSSQTFEWAEQAGSSTLSDAASDLAIDANENLYMTGDIQGAANFGGGIILTTPSTAPDIFISKHDSSGQVLWAVNYGDSDQEYGTGIATDNVGNIYIIGNSANTVTIGGITLTANGPNEEIAFLIKLNSSGTFQWVRKINSQYSGSAGDIVIDSNNNIFITGSLSDYSSGNGDGLFIAKYNTSGAQIWYNTYGFGFYTKQAFSIATDYLGNLIIAGRYMQTITLGSFTLNTSTTLDMDGFVAKIDALGNNVLWAEQLTSPGQGQDALNSIVVDSMNNIYLVGHVDSTATIGGITLPLSDGDKMILVKLDQSGNAIWVKSSTGGGYPERLIYGYDNNVYLTGHFNTTLQIDSTIITAIGGNEAFIVAMDTSSKILWAKEFGGTLDENSNGIVSNSNNELYVAGEFRGTVSFASTVLTSAGSSDIFIAKFKQCDPPVANITYAGGPLCAGQTASLSTDYCPTYEYQWQYNGVDILGATTPTYTATQSGSYSVVASAFTGCETQSSVVNLLFNSIPSPAINGNTSLCDAVSTTILNAGGGFTSYQWSNGATSQTTTVAAGTYFVTVTNAAGCSAVASTSVTVNQGPIVIAGSDTSITQGNSIILGGNPTALGIGPFTYNWSPTVGLNNDTIANPIATPLVTTAFVVLITDANGCSNTDTILVDVPLAVLELNNSNIIIYPNPTNDLLNIHISGLINDNCKIILTNTLGQILNEEKIRLIGSSVEIQIDMKYLSSGIYFLIVNSNHMKKSFKVQKH